MAQIFKPTDIDEIVNEVSKIKPRPKIIVLVGRHEPEERTISIAESVDEMESVLFVQFPQSTKGFFLAVSDALNELVDDMCRGIKVAGDIYSSASYRRYGLKLRELIEYDKSQSTKYLNRACYKENTDKRDYCNPFNTDRAWDFYYKLWDIIQEKAGFIDNDVLITILRKKAKITKRTIFVDLHSSSRKIPKFEGGYNTYEKRLRNDVRYNKIAGICTPYIGLFNRVLRIRRSLEKVPEGVLPIRISKYMCGDIISHQNYYDEERSFLIEFFQDGRKYLELTDEEKRKVIPAINFSFIFDHTFDPIYLPTRNLCYKDCAKQAKSLGCLLENMLAHHKYITN